MGKVNHLIGVQCTIIHLKIVDQNITAAGTVYLDTYLGFHKDQSLISLGQTRFSFTIERVDFVTINTFEIEVPLYNTSIFEPVLYVVWDLCLSRRTSHLCVHNCLVFFSQYQKCWCIQFEFPVSCHPAAIIPRCFSLLFRFKDHSITYYYCSKFPRYKEQGKRSWKFFVLVSAWCS